MKLITLISIIALSQDLALHKNSNNVLDVVSTSQNKVRVKYIEVLFGQPATIFNEHKRENLFLTVNQIGGFRKDETACFQGSNYVIEALFENSKAVISRGPHVRKVVKIKNLLPPKQDNQEGYSLLSNDDRL